MKRKLMLVLFPLVAMAIAGCQTVDRGDNPDEPKQCETVSVTLSKTSLNLGIGGTYTLLATVDPVNCPVTWKTSNSAVASVSQSGVVTGVSEGRAVVSVGNASCTVTVSATPTPPDPEKEVVSVEVSDHPQTVYQGEEVNPGLVELVVAFSDDTHKKVYADSVECDTSEIGEVTATAINDEYGSATFAISVIEKEESTMKEAYEAAAALSDDQVTAEMTFSGVVVGYRLATNDYFLQDGEYGIDIWNPSNKSIFEVGKKLTVTATLQNYGGIIETKVIKKIEEAGTGTLPTPVVIDGLVALTTSKVNTLAQVNSAIIENAPEYVEGHDLSLNLNVNDEEVKLFFKKAQLTNYKTFIESLSDGCEIKIKKAIIGKHGTEYQLLVADQTEFSLVSVSERELDHIAIEGALQKDSFVEGQTYNSNGLYVMAYYDDGTSSKVSAEILIDKTKAALGDTSLTFSAEFDGKTAEITVNITVTQKSEEGVGAIYTFNNTWEKTGTNISGMSQDDFMGALEFEGDEIITGYKDPTNVYFGGNGGSGTSEWKILDSLKIGKGAKDGVSGHGSITLTLDSSISFDGIKVKAIGNRDDGALTINGVTENVNKKATSSDLNPVELSFDISGGISELVLSSKESTSSNLAIVITSIEFIGGGVTPTPPDPTKVIDEIAIEGTPTKLTYSVGEKYSANGLHIQAYYTDSTTAQVAGTITPSKEIAEKGDTTISFNATVDGFVAQTVTFGVEVKEEGGGEIQTTTVTKAISDISGTTTDATQVTSMTMDSVITLTTNGDGNNGKVYSSGAQWRIYHSNNGVVTVNAASGYVIVSVCFTYSVDKKGFLTYGGATVNSGDVVTVNAQTADFASDGGESATKQNGQVRITNVSVVYKAA